MRLRSLPIPLVLALVAACRDATDAGEDPATRVATVFVYPVDTTLTSIGDTVQLWAEARVASGAPRFDVGFTWASGNPSAGRVSNVGVVEAVGPGTATITATTHGVSGSTRVTVAQEAHSLVVTPAAAAVIGLGSTLQLSAAVLDARGHAIAGAAVTWASGDSSIARVSPTGLVTAVSSGTTAVTASAAGLTAVSNVWVRTTGVPGKWLVIVSGNGQAATQHQVLGVRLAVRAFDQEGVGIPGVTVTFAAPAGGGQITCHRYWDGPGRAAVQYVTDATGLAAQPATVRDWPPPGEGCTPHSAGRVQLQATSPGFEPATFTFDVVAAGQPIDGFYAYVPFHSYDPYFEIRHPDTVASDSSVSPRRFLSLDCWQDLTGTVTVDSLGQATVSGTSTVYCWPDSGVPRGTGTWAAVRH